MSENLDQSRLQRFLERLRQQAEPQKNDVRHRHYVGYVNVFVGKFGNEKAYLVGSTAEGLKLRWSKDGGDADFLLCSGLFEIPVENLEFKKDTPCFVWVKANGLQSKIKFDLIKDGNTEYIPTDVLRTVSPDMFTMLRGLYLIITSTLDTIPGRKSRVTTTALSSRVGLARTEYRNLFIPDGYVPHPKDRQSKVKRQRTKRSHYGDDVTIHKNDKEMIDAILNIIALVKKSESSGSHDGQFGNFAHVIDVVKRRRELGSEYTKVIGNETSEEGATYLNDLSESSEDDTAENNLSPGVKRARDSVKVASKPSGVKCTYEEKTCKDFVPAIRIKGMLQFMVDWKRRAGFWPRIADRERIADCEVFVVSRYASVSPDKDRDFCLSFNQQELGLARCMSETQRDVFLILKSFLKGGFQLKYNTRSWDTEMGLKTFHLKTALYWVCEKEDPKLWQANKIPEAVCKVLRFLLEALEKTRLEHYFVPENNLFADMQKRDSDFIKECIEEAIEDPVSYINHFFSLDDGKPVTIELKKDELQTLMEIKDDGGLDKEAEAIEEAIIDFHKGLNAGPRDDSGKAPIVAAIKATADKFLDDVERGELADLQDKHDREKVKAEITNYLRALEITEATNMTGPLSDMIQIYNRVTGQTDDTSSGVANVPTNPVGSPSDIFGSICGAFGIRVTGNNLSTNQSAQVQPGISQQSAESSRERAEGQVLLSGLVNLVANYQNMDRASRRSARDQLKEGGLPFFSNKPF